METYNVVDVIVFTKNKNKKIIKMDITCKEKMLSFLSLLIAGEQQLTWKKTDRKIYLGDRLVLKFYGPQLPKFRVINEVLVQRNDFDQVLSHCLRARDTCVDHEDGIHVRPIAYFSNFEIILSSVRLLHIGNYSCAFYDNDSLLIETKYTYVDVSGKLVA